MIARRAFLGSLLAAAGTPRLSWADVGSPAWLGAARDADGSYVLLGLARDGAERFRIALPTRGHAAAAHPTAPEAVAFARRPGTFALVVNCLTGEVTHRLQSPEGRHFYGHGAFIAKGEILCTTENEIETGAGRIGLWSRKRGYARIGEIASHGIGPHEILNTAGDVLVVANGGIRTHPDQGRGKLNIPEMRPSLAYIAPDGALLENVVLDPELHMNSIRHLAQAPDGTVGFAMQWQGESSDPVPLLGLHERGKEPRLLSADLGEQLAMQGYAGSVAFSRDGTDIAITSPRGGRVHRFDVATGAVQSLARADVCGIAAGPDGMVATDGLGGLMRLGARPEPIARFEGLSWDNHLIAL